MNQISRLLRIIPRIPKECAILRLVALPLHVSIHFRIDSTTLRGIVIPRHTALFARDEAININSTVNIVIFRIINTGKIVIVDGCNVVLRSLIVRLQIVGILQQIVEILRAE